MRSTPSRWHLLLGLGLALPLGLTRIPPAQAAWSAGGSGNASASAYTMPIGSQPTAVASGTSVSVRWPAALFPAGQSVDGYVIQRYNATSGAPATVGAACSGTVTSTTCTELNVPAGTWIYADTPVQDKWTGGSSPTSASVSVL
jgi:hypothetical protein